MTRQKTNGLHKSEANRCAIIQPKKRTSKTSRSREIKRPSSGKAEWMRGFMVHGTLGDFKSKIILKSGTGNGLLFGKRLVLIRFCCTLYTFNGYPPVMMISVLLVAVFLDLPAHERSET